MKNEKLLDAIGKIDEDLVYDAVNDSASKKEKRFPKWARWSSAIAACLVLAISLGFLLPRMGGNSSTGGNAGGGGHDEGSAFMSYAGPVFPLSLREENTAITAQRDITMNFAPWVPVWISNEEEFATRSNLSEEDREEFLEMYNEWYPEGGRYESSSDILVTDSYLLTNDYAHEQTIQILYPFVSSLNNLTSDRPVLELNGATLEATLHAGSYAGVFQGAWENWAETHENPGSLNLLQLDSWEGYQSLLADGSYLDRALGGFVDLSHIPVVVYEFTDAWGPEENDAAGIPNPSIRVMFELNYDNTTVLSYGFHSGSYDRENGIMGRGFSIREEDERGYGTPYYLIIIGDDIENMECQGFATGGWDTKKKVESGVTVARSESDLETALRQAAHYNYQEMVDVGNYYQWEYSFELYFGLMKEHLVAYGALAENGAERYDTGSIEELDVVGVSRVFWLEAEITIPAGESVTLDAVFMKDPSYDHYCAATENKGVSGYDLVTALGSNLTFTQQTARLEDQGQIEIVRQNFGFDIANGINKVSLDLNVPHYYMEVKKLPANNN